MIPTLQAAVAAVRAGLPLLAPVQGGEGIAPTPLQLVFGATAAPRPDAIAPARAPHAPSPGGSTAPDSPTSPHGPTSPTGAGAAGSGGASGFGVALLAVLLALASVTAQRFTRITLPPATARSFKHTWLLERPG
jgi:hypothetical protein